MEILICLLTAILSSVPAIAQEPIDNQIIRESKPTVVVTFPQISETSKKTAEQVDSLHLVASDKPQDPSYLGTFRLSRYYSITADQTDKLPYEKDIESMIMMNCWKWGTEWCKTTANGHVLVDEDIGYVYSCPPNIPLWTKIRLEFDWGTRKGICHDRGGSIKWKRLDSYCWAGNNWVSNIRNNTWCYTWKARVRIEE